MKFLAFFTIAFALYGAENFTTGQAARLVIGQRTFTAQEPGASATLLGGVGGLAYADDMLVVTDANRISAQPINNRVLIFKNLSTKLPKPTAELPVDGGRCPVCTGAADVVLGQPDFDQADLKPASQTTLRTPIAVATNGHILAVADTDNNRVLIWNSIPTTNDAPADIVLGQPDFTKVLPNDGQGYTPTPTSLKGPQGVWIQGTQLFVADTGNNRVLIWNSIPTQNHQAADVVLGQKDFATFVQPDLTKAVVEAKATTMLSPVSVTSDGQRLFVADLAQNRVLVWNTIPTQNQAPADLAIGQADLESAIANNATAVCQPTGQDADGNDVFPVRCGATLEYPRYALSDGTRLFIADGGNDRILIYNTIPTQSGQSADVVIGQLSDQLNLVSDSGDFARNSASPATVRAPMSLAFDGTNLYASDPFNRRVLVFTIAERKVPNTGVRNGASLDVFAVGFVTFDGTVTEGDEVTITIADDRKYTYKILKDDDFGNVIQGLVNEINAGAGDPDVLASPDIPFYALVLTARAGGTQGDDVAFAVTTSAGAQIVPTTSGANLSGGGDAAQIAPGTIVSIVGEDLSDDSAAVPSDAQELPRELAGVQVYFDGIRAPLYYVSPTQINAQVPVEVLDAQGINAYVRTQRKDGSVSVSTAVAVPIISENPGIFAAGGIDPRPAVALHSSSEAIGTVSVDGTAQAGDVATVTIEDRDYTYTVKADDTREIIRDALIDLINQDPKVEAFAAGVFTRVRLRARVAGADGNGIAYSATTNDGAQVILTATTPALCCANVAGSPVTPDNPALPGEVISVYATGLGLVMPDEARAAQQTGVVYNGPELNEPNEFVSSLAGGKTANVLYAGLQRGTIGVYRVDLELNSDLPTNPETQLTIAQSFYVSNIVTIPVYNPNPPEPQ